MAYSSLGGADGERRNAPGNRAGKPIPTRGSTVLLPPWDYLFTRFSAHTLPDLYTPFWVATAILLVALIVLYNARTRALHRHAPYLDLYEWLLWSGISLFGLLLVAAVFNFYMIVLLVILVSGLAVMLWVRFIRFPPILDLYEHKLAKQRYFTRSKFAHPESTIRPKGARTSTATARAGRARASRNRKRR